MDTRQWQAFPVNEEANRKRPWDAISTSTTEGVIPRSHLSSHIQEDREHTNPEWKRPRSEVQTGTSNLWETNVQTSLWLAQQNSLEPDSSIGRDAHNGPAVQGRHHHSDREYSSGISVPSDPRSTWPIYAEDSDKATVRNSRSSGIRPFSAATNRLFMRYEDSPKPASSNIPELQGTAASQPRKVSIIPDIEQHCEKCCENDPAWWESTGGVNRLIESLFEGSLFEVIDQYRREGTSHENIPLVAEIHRVFDLIREANSLAKHVIQSAPNYLQGEVKGSPQGDTKQGNDLQSSLEIMKKRFLAESEDALKSQRRQSCDINYALEAHGYPSLAPESTTAAPPRRPSMMGDSNRDRLPPIRTQTPSQAPHNEFVTKLPSMKPPPTPSRQLPSPPARSHPSPPSYNIPSPSSLLYPQSVASTNAGPQQSGPPNVSHPLSPTPSSSLGTTTGTTTALQAHTAALQHEVSVKKYALQTLQSEHDKVLAALRRSQTRAHTLEEKQVTSDLEINTLSEERVRLLAQISELEQTVVEVSKSRDEFRQAAVKEGAQYVKIVRMASRLEMMAGDERKEWKRQMSDSKVKIEALQVGLRAGSAVNVAGSSPEARATYDGTVVELKQEVQRLRAKCADFETALVAIRTEGRRFGEAVAILGSAGGHILTSVDTALAHAQTQ